MARKKRDWISNSVKRPGRVRRYLKELYGERAFTREGRIKNEYLDKAIKHVKNEKLSKEEKRSLLLALYLAKKLKRIRK